MRLSDSKPFRITRKSQFEHLFASGRRIESAAFRLQVAPPFLGVPKIAFVATKRQGNAVVRNRSKRRMRELFRHYCASNILTNDVVIIAKRPVVDWEFSRLERDFKYVMRKACGRFVGERQS
ncbi:ribonuclease P protein component [bacterium]|nr:ribonuclease P protein component [bacterium]